MGLSRMASKCNICPQRDRCSRKRMEGLGYQFLGGTEHSGSCTCSDLNGRVFRVDEAEPGVNLPPIHPNCLCIIRAYFKKSVFAKREGNPLDGNIKFEEWKKKYAS